MARLPFADFEDLGLLFALQGLLTRMAEPERCCPFVLREGLLAGCEAIWGTE